MAGSEGKRILGVGVGLFIVSFLFSIALLLCIGVWRSSRGRILVVLTWTIVIIISLFLILAPREPIHGKDETGSEAFDNSVAGRTSAIIIMSLFVLVGLLFSCKTHLMEERLAASNTHHDHYER